MFDPSGVEAPVIPVLTYQEHLRRIESLKESWGEEIKILGYCKPKITLWETGRAYLNDVAAGTSQAEAKGTVVYRACVVKAQAICIMIYYVERARPITDWRRWVEGFTGMFFTREEINSKVAAFRAQYGDIAIREVSMLEAWRHIYSPQYVPDGYMYLATFIIRPIFPFQVIPIVVYVFTRVGTYDPPKKRHQRFNIGPILLLAGLGVGVVFIVMSQSPKPPKTPSVTAES